MPTRILAIAAPLQDGPRSPRDAGTPSALLWYRRRRVVGTGSAAAVAALVRPVALVAHVAERRHRDDMLAVADLEDDDALARAARHADSEYRAADHRAAIGDQHDLVFMGDRKDGDDMIPALGQRHVDEPLPAAPGDAVIIGRAARPEASLGDAEAALL